MLFVSWLKQVVNTPGVILDVWRALGGEELRNGRGRAFWRDGDGLNVKVDSQHNRWFDFVFSEGGGILRLIEIALRCSKSAAIRWLADFSGVELDEETPERRRRRVETYRTASEISIDAALWSRALSVEIERLYSLSLNGLDAASGLGCLDDEAFGQAADEVMARYGRLRYVLLGGDPEYLLRLYLAMRRSKPEATRALVEWGRADLEDADAWAGGVADLLLDTAQQTARSDIA